jgi:uncharacterized protein (TIGR04255 family)
MPFPESPRVLYDLNPLVEVVCQVRFPTVLRVASQQPAAFQDRIRAAFPIFTQQVTAPVQGLPPQLASLVGSALAGSATAYEFASEDGVWKLGLTRDFLALTSTKYTEWADFRQRLEAPLAALVAEYQPTFFQRIGLRYRDVIVPDTLGLAGVPWSELLRAEVAGELGSDLEPITHAMRELVVELPERRGNVRVVHGLDLDPQNLRCYVIDCDFFTDAKVGTNEALSVLDKFNGHAGSLFRWCIQPRLSAALRPRSV